MTRTAISARSAHQLAIFLLVAALAVVAAPGHGRAAGGYEKPVERVYDYHPPAPARQTLEEAAAKSEGCVTCHSPMDNHTMHENPAVVIGCTDCHGGDASVKWNAEWMPGSMEYESTRDRAHVLPTLPESWGWPSAANPKISYTLLNREHYAYTRFVNPSDYRVATDACGACHQPVIEAAERSLMATGAMFWGGAAYNNGILPNKNYNFGEAYTKEGEPRVVKSPVEVTDKMRARGITDVLYPLPAFETVPSGDIFRAFERGGRNVLHLFPEVGNPNSLGQIQRLEEAGRPDLRQSNRGPATGLRISVPILNVTKTRLNDPFTWFLGTNDQPGDFRSSGCASCHVVYANDRDPRHSGKWAKYGHWGESAQADPTIPRDVPGHPINHVFTRAIPTSQCMICHMHQPNMFVNTYLGYTMWDYESDAPRMWPEEQQYPTHEEAREVYDRNPEGAAPRGKWADLDFLSQVWDMNDEMEHTQFADYHGHGWNFRAIHKRDRKGNLLDKDGEIVANDDPHKWEKTVHMASIHLDKGMHCVDCHFAQDGHGNGYIHTEVAAAVQIRCADCHGTADKLPTLRTSGPAAQPGGQDLTLIRNPDGKARFEWKGDTLIQRSILNPGLEWEMSLTKHTVDPDHPDYNAKAARAKLMSGIKADGAQTMLWGPGVAPEDRAHKDSEMACFTCHTSWTTSCGGCHLPIEANWKTERHKYEGGITRNWASYNPQVARDAMFQLGKHGPVKDNIIAPVRSSSALVLSSTNINRERIYIQQPPISSSGYSSQAFAPHFPHTTRLEETKTCTDCHVSEENDNNAIMAQLLLQGTQFVNFVGFNAWVGGDGGFQAVTVTEWDEPQAVIGSYLHKYAYPDWYQAHLDRGRELRTGEVPDLLSETQTTGEPARCLQLRGEYLYVAQGSDGMQVWDVASIANKGFSDRIVQAPFSPLGHDTTIGSRDATCVKLATTQPVHWDRSRSEYMQEVNLEQPMHEIYRYAFITDAEEGLILTDVGTMYDGEPRNNFLERALTWNEGGLLDGADQLAIVGNYVYVSADAGLVVLDMSTPLEPRHVTTLDFDGADVRGAMQQFRYLWVTTSRGLHLVDITDQNAPRKVPEAFIALEDARNVFLARTFAYVANGAAGLAIVDVTKPEEPFIYQKYNADGRLSDTRDVIVASTNASLFAYVADGVNGLAVLQLTSPDTQPGFYGYSPDVYPEFIAWRKTRWPALSLSRPLERDRAVDESGNQIAVMGRIGSRPFNLEEQQRFYLDDNAQVYKVTDEVREGDLVRTRRALQRRLDEMRGRALQPEKPDTDERAEMALPQ